MNEHPRPWVVNRIHVGTKTIVRDADGRVVFYVDRNGHGFDSDEKLAQFIVDRVNKGEE